MCHVLLALPLVALPVFWIWPLPAALPVYGAVVGLSALIYWYAIRAMRQPKQNGADGMAGETGRIVVDDLGQIHIQVRSELWEAVSPVPMRHGDHVRVVAAEHTRLRVQRPDAAPPGNSSGADEVRI